MGARRDTADKERPVAAAPVPQFEWKVLERPSKG